MSPCVAADQGQTAMPTPKGAIPYIALARRKADERSMLALIIDDTTDKIVQGMSKDAGKNDQRLQSPVFISSFCDRRPPHCPTR
jgi:hypothetical protein